MIIINIEDRRIRVNSLKHFLNKQESEPQNQSKETLLVTTPHVSHNIF